MSNRTSVTKFSAGLKGWARLNRKQAVTVQRAIGVHVYTGVTQQWPVDTGRSRAGWVGSTGLPSANVPSEGKHPAPTPPSFAALKFGEAIWIANNVEYAVALNEGHSGQMPAGAVETTLARVVNEFNAGVPR